MQLFCICLLDDSSLVNDSYQLLEHILILMVAVSGFALRPVSVTPTLMDLRGV
jgi:hypothetical protein